MNDRLRYMGYLRTNNLWDGKRFGLNQYTINSANNVVLTVVDSKTGEKANFGTKKTIIEVFKKENIRKNNFLNSKINNRLKNNNVLKFY